MVIRKLSKQFDRAVLEGTRLSMAVVKSRLAALVREQAQIEESQSVYLMQVEQKRDKIRQDLLDFKECSHGYKSIYYDVKQACKQYVTV